MDIFVGVRFVEGMVGWMWCGVVRKKTSRFRLRLAHSVRARYNRLIWPAAAFVVRGVHGDDVVVSSRKHCNEAGRKKSKIKKKVREAASDGRCRERGRWRYVDGLISWFRTTATFWRGLAFVGREGKGGGHSFRSECPRTMRVCTFVAT